MSNTDSLLVTLNTTNLQKTDNRLYQVLKSLIENLLVDEKTLTAIAAVISGGTVPTNLSTATVLTASNETVLFPNSRNLLAGTNVTFDDSVANQRTVNVSASADYVVMSDGNTPTPSPMNDGNGNFLYVTYTP